MRSVQFLRFIYAFILFCYCIIPMHASSADYGYNSSSSVNDSLYSDITSDGDTLYHYISKPVDLGVINNSAPVLLYRERLNKVRRGVRAVIPDALSKERYYVGKIPFTEGVGSTGGKTYSIPVLTARSCGLTPQLSLSYNSQGGNGTAGYGWNIAGTSAISVVGKTIHYDGFTAPVNLSKPNECAFALDGVRLVGNTKRLTEYEYETSQGFILVKKHTFCGEISYFTVAYPNGNTATFGFKENKKTRHIYPITELTDIKGYKINFSYIESGNCYFLSKVSYGGKDGNEHTAEILFNYEDKGRLEKTSLPFKSDSPILWNTYRYDSYDRPISLTEASGKQTTWSYNGLSTTETKEGISTTRTIDALGEVIRVEDAGGSITYTLRPDGQPTKITAPGNVVTSFEYDVFGRRTAIIDPSAGKRTFSNSYAGDGTLTLEERNADGRTLVTTYDKYGRVIGKRNAEFSTACTYNTDGLLVSEESTNGTSLRLFYDAYDRLSLTLEKAPDGKFLQKKYTYNNGNISSVQNTSQNGELCTENYIYKNGYNTEITLGDDTDGTNDIKIWELKEENDLGLPTSVKSGVLTESYNYTETGLPRSYQFDNIRPENTYYPVFALDNDFDIQTGNLLSRTNGRYKHTEIFTYDNLNRLEKVGYRGEDYHLVYSDNGNILQKQGVGELSYSNPSRPYQVTCFYPQTDLSVPQRNQHITYISLMRPASIKENGITATFEYNADGDRVMMSVVRDATPLLIRYYIGNGYEYDIDSMGVETERFYIGGDAYNASAVLIKSGGSAGHMIYRIMRDYLGSIIYITDNQGYLIQEMDYDSWGRLRDSGTLEVYDAGKEPELFLGRGYTGHEHLPWFGLINMNARLYDPVLGRFLSPDPYVQMPDFTQNFNRYSYCMNNPLKFVDKSGEFLHLIIGAVIGGVVNWAAHGFKFNAKGLGYFAVGAAAGAVGAGVGAGISSALPVMGNTSGGFLAGFLGTNTATTATTSFISGALIGGGAGLSSGFVSGFGNGLVDGKNFSQALWSGVKDGFVGGVSGALFSGVVSGIDAVTDGRNFWHGGRQTLDVSLSVPQVNQVGQYDCSYACAESVDHYYGNGRDQSFFQSLEPGNGIGLTDKEIVRMYGKAGYAARPISIDASKPILTVEDIADTMNANKAVVLSYKTGISGGINYAGQRVVFAHATVVTRVRIYDNGRFIINVMNPGGSTTRFINVKYFHKILGIY